ncbi:MAG: alpha/beta hydrolase, partial [Deltaproteobacteria bacterium]|nr:alpha/beta hydrolase [Deltaproteobacteria bacterium]
MSEVSCHWEVCEGRGPFVLLVHGVLSSRAQWSPNLPALQSVARPVIVELWGHGRSPSPSDAARYDPAAYVREFEKIRETLGAQRWLVCGQSLGGALTLRYALDHPQRLI